MYSSSVKRDSFLSSSSRLRCSLSSLTWLYRFAKYSILSIYSRFLQFCFISAIFINMNNRMINFVCIFRKQLRLCTSKELIRLKYSLGKKRRRAVDEAARMRPKLASALTLNMRFSPKKSPGVK